MPRNFGKRDVSVGWARCAACDTRHEPGSGCPPISARQRPAPAGEAIWLIAPMPDRHWPVDPRLPRDDSWSWWVRSHCGHRARQWAFHDRGYALMYEHVFRADPCRYTQCQDQKRGGETP